MKPIRVINGTYTEHWRYMGQDIIWNIPKDLWSCTCVGNSAYARNCKHIVKCKKESWRLDYGKSSGMGQIEEKE